MLLLTNLENVEEYEMMLQRLIAELDKPIVLGENCIATVTASVGVILFPCDTHDPDALLRHADQAMYQAKSLGRNLITTFAMDKSFHLLASTNEKFTLVLTHKSHPVRPRIRRFHTASVDSGVKRSEWLLASAQIHRLGRAKFNRLQNCNHSESLICHGEGANGNYQAVQESLASLSSS